MYLKYENNKKILTAISAKVLNIAENTTLDNIHNNKFLNCINLSEITINIPNLVENFEVSINQDTDNIVTIKSAQNVNIRREGSTDTEIHQLVGKYSLVFIKKVDINEYRAYGGLVWV